jgi:SAM-dependent methyltransferase
LRSRASGRANRPADQPVRPTRGPSSSSARYIFPRHAGEVDRLDLQHYALHEALGGHYLAPVSTPQFLLDVGCGSGQWAYDLCTEYPDALVVGIDLVPSKPDRPPNFRFVRGNVLQGLPLVPDRFDFVHQRLLVGGVPMNTWPALVLDLVRVTRPGGWIELVEVGFEVEPAGPATKRMVEMMQRLGRSLGLDTTGIVLRSLSEYLHRAGVTDIQQRGVTLPIGEWGGRIGSFLASDFRAAATRVCSVFQAKFGLSADECRDLLNAMPQEWEAHKSQLSFAYAFGRRAA